MWWPTRNEKLPPPRSKAWRASNWSSLLIAQSNKPVKRSSLFSCIGLLPIRFKVVKKFAILLYRASLVMTASIGSQLSNQVRGWHFVHSGQKTDLFSAIRGQELFSNLWRKQLPERLFPRVKEEWIGQRQMYKELCISGLVLLSAGRGINGWLWLMYNWLLNYVDPCLTLLSFRYNK